MAPQITVTHLLGARHYTLTVASGPDWIPAHLVAVTRAIGGTWRDTASKAQDRPPGTRMVGRTIRRRYPWPVSLDHQRPYGPSPFCNRDDPRIPGYERPHDPYPGYV
jgi:hypothetical protein